MSESQMFDTENAACANEDPELFFPEGAAGRSVKVAQAKQICATCPVAVQCLQFAISNEIVDGIWGGTTASERKAMTSRRTIIVGKPKK